MLLIFSAKIQINVARFAVFNVVQWDFLGDFQTLWNDEVGFSRIIMVEEMNYQSGWKIPLGFQHSSKVRKLCSTLQQKCLTLKEIKLHLTWLSINLVKRQFRELWKSLALSYEIGIFFNFQFLMSQCKNFNWLQPFFKMCTWTHCTESSHFVHNVNLHRSDMNDLRSFEVIRGRCIQ